MQSAAEMTAPVERRVTKKYTGNRVYLSIPLQRIPQGVSPEGFAATTVAATTLTTIHNGVGHVQSGRLAA